MKPIRIFVLALSVFAIPGEAAELCQPKETAFLREGLIGCWRLDGNSYDSSGLANHAVVVGDPIFTEGVAQQAMYLDGWQQYLIIDSVTNDVTDNDITLSGWIKTFGWGASGATSVDWFSCNGAPANSSDNVFIFTIYQGRITAFEPGRGFQAESDTIVSDGEWHMLTYTRKRYTGGVYVDGVAR